MVNKKCVCGEPIDKLIVGYKDILQTELMCSCPKCNRSVTRHIDSNLVDMYLAILDDFDKAVTERSFMQDMMIESCYPLIRKMTTEKASELLQTRGYLYFDEVFGYEPLEIDICRLSNCVYAELFGNGIYCHKHEKFLDGSTIWCMDATNPYCVNMKAEEN